MHRRTGAVIMRRWMLAAVVGLVAIDFEPVRAAPSAPPLTEAGVRAFVARQERAWNARDAGAFFAGFVPTAIFVDQARTPKGELIRYGSSTVSQARRQTARYFSRTRAVDRTVIERVELSPDRRSARVVGRKTSVADTGGRTRRACALTEQILISTKGQVYSRGQTETAIRCAS